MDMTGERRIPAPRQAVWDALNDLAVLKASIPGCESLEKTSDTTMKATVSLKIGPISARFTGTVMLSDLDAPNGYTISGEGQGGVAGFAKGGAKVRLADDGAGGTILTYEVHAQVGGKVAQLGARLIDASAKQISDQFFDRFGAAVAPPVPPAAIPAAPAMHQPPPPRPMAPRPMPSAVGMTDLVPREPFGLPMAAWIGGLVFLFLVLLYIGSIF
jgi:carbon monoxide dehydrogenase subunit G